MNPLDFPSARQLIVLTAALEPEGTPSLVRTSFRERRGDYLAAVRHYSSTLPSAEFQLLIVENTGANCDDLVAEAQNFGHSLRVLQYSEESIVQARGKGNAEALMFDRVGAWLGKEPERFSRITKITGRLIVKNCRGILAEPESARSISARISMDHSQVDTRFFSMDPQTWLDHFLEMESQVVEPKGRYLEHVVALRSAAAIFQGVEWRSYTRMPSIAGFSGSTGVAYGGRRGAFLDFVAGRANVILKGHYI